MIPTSALSRLAALVAGAALCACGAMEAAELSAMPFDGPGGSSGGGLEAPDGGIDADYGKQDAAPGTAKSYAVLCGGGCTPGDPASPADDAGGGEPAECPQGGDGNGGAPPYDCQLVVDAKSGEVSGACRPVGGSLQGQPCESAADCAAGLGCVAPGACRAYCCGSPDACAKGTYCVPQAMFLDELPQGLPAPPQIPVCVPATSCTLLDDSSCEDDLSCTIVKTDGTTSCVAPGGGQAGDPCPCASGHVCSVAAGKCLKLCKLGYPGDCPEGHTCQGGSSGYPVGFGVCVKN
ncbi:MAG: hypothetical protein HY744_10970 [Deltaproteobacteria bacterium]|nr:hypothetical protein [Deltaproteobacteria bacterium]